MKLLVAFFYVKPTTLSPAFVAGSAWWSLAHGGLVSCGYLAAFVPFLGQGDNFSKSVCSSRWFTRIVTVIVLFFSRRLRGSWGICRIMFWHWCCLAWARRPVGIWPLSSWRSSALSIGFLMRIWICHLLPVGIIKCGTTVPVDTASQLPAESKARIKSNLGKCLWKSSDVLSCYGFECSLTCVWIYNNIFVLTRVLNVDKWTCVCFWVMCTCITAASPCTE